LLIAVTRQIRTLDEGFEAALNETNIQTTILNAGDFAGYNCILAQFARCSCIAGGVTLKLLDAKRDAFLFDVHVEDLSADHLALLVFLDDLLARTIPVEIGKVNH